MLEATGWQDYQVLDCGDGLKLERWGKIVVSRPDPQVIWPKATPDRWDNADALYQRSDKGGGVWVFNKRLPEDWVINWRDLRFLVRPTGFKHMGLFPEQAANWAWLRSLMQGKTGRRALNLFAYTGGATVALAKEGVQVTHVDAAKGMVQWAKENRDLNGIDEGLTRFIIEDALAFVKREKRRGSRYHAIVMDPPSFGRGPGGEVWKLEDALFELVKETTDLLADDAQCFVINGYTTGIQAGVMAQILRATLPERGGQITADELMLPIASGGFLPCGCAGRWQMRKEGEA